MTPKEQLIDALRRLCNSTDGGFRAVADTIGVDDQTLYQIVKGVKLPSGEPRGVGPTLQRKLSAHYPDWAAAPTGATAEPSPAVRAARAAYLTGGAATWPFRRIRLADIVELSEADLGFIEGQLMAALREIGAGPSSKRPVRKAM